MSNQEPNEAVTPEEMEKIVQGITSKKEESIVNTKAVENETASSNAAPKIAANAEEVRLPSMSDLANINAEEKVLANSEVLHENITVGAPATNYDASNRVPDTVTTEDAFAKIQAAKDRSAAGAGQGVVIEKKAEDTREQIVGMSPDSQDHLDKYLANMDKDMVESQDVYDQLAAINPNLQPTPEQHAIMQDQARATDAQDGANGLRTSDTVEESDRARRAKEAIVIIDKLEAQNLKFTPAQQAKLDEADVIRIKEVKTVDLKTIRRRREKRNSVHQAIQRGGNTMRHTTVLLPASGYYVEMLGCAPYEIMTLQNEEDPLTDAQVKWSLIYEKIKWNSIGLQTFEDFMANTAIADYETFVWGILRSTFEDTDKISLNCVNPACTVTVGKEKNQFSYDYNYSVLGLLRAEDITDRMKEVIDRVVEAKTLEEAVVAHQLAPVNDTLVIELPDSGYVVEIGISTVNDFLNRTLQHLSDETLEVQYRQAAIIATALRSVNILAEDGFYDEYEELNDITEIVYKLTSNDLVVLAHKVQEHTEKVSFSYGFIDLKCPRCNHVTPHQPMEVESVLFYRNALSMNVSVE